MSYAPWPPVPLNLATLSITRSSTTQRLAFNTTCSPLMQPQQWRLLTALFMGPHFLMLKKEKVGKAERLRESVETLTR